MKKILSLWSKGDKLILFLPICLSLFGLATIFNASSVSGQVNFNDSFHFFKLQGLWLFLGLLSLVFFSLFDFHWLKKFSVFFLASSMILLVVVLVPGVGKVVNGGRRWIQFGFLGFQPAEFAKIALVIYFSSFFEKKCRWWPFFLLSGLTLLLVMLEPDLGTAVVILGTVICLYFIAGAPLIHFSITAITALLAGVILIAFSPYRRERLLTFLNSSFDPQGASYHIRQILIALGSGGFWGQGFGQSKQKFLFLPEVTTDSIFAVIAEELGFLWTAFLVLIFIFLIYRGMVTAIKSKDQYGRLLASSLTLLLGFQVVINLGAMVALFPLTGIPLPFVSYGGSSLVIFLSAMGIVYNISKTSN